MRLKPLQAYTTCNIITGNTALKIQDSVCKTIAGKIMNE
jgi:hypothetical protein